MPNIREIKQRQLTVSRIRKITYAMQVIAETRTARIKKRAVAAKNYHHKIRQILSDVVARSSETYHPLMETREKIENIALILIGSDEGLCGGFNHNIANRAKIFIQANRDKNFKFITLGRKAEKFLRGADEKQVIKKFSGIADKTRCEICGEVSQKVISLYLSREIDGAFLIYNEYKLNLLGRAAELKILPIEPVPHLVTEKTISDYLYEPSAEELLSALLPEYVFDLIFYAVLESKASEELARMMAMKAATDNADEMMKKLMFSYHKARQANITNEIAEIVNAAQ